MKAMAGFQQRFEALAEQGPKHEHLDPIEKYQEMLRSRIFPDHPPLT